MYDYNVIPCLDRALQHDVERAAEEYKAKWGSKCTQQAASISRDKGQEMDLDEEGAGRRLDGGYLPQSTGAPVCLAAHVFFPCVLAMHGHLFPAFTTPIPYLQHAYLHSLPPRALTCTLPAPALWPCPSSALVYLELFRKAFQLARRRGAVLQRELLEVLVLVVRNDVVHKHPHPSRQAYG